MAIALEHPILFFLVLAASVLWLVVAVRYVASDSASTDFLVRLVIYVLSGAAVACFWSLVYFSLSSEVYYGHSKVGSFVVYPKKEPMEFWGLLLLDHFMGLNFLALGAGTFFRAKASAN